MIVRAIHNKIEEKPFPIEVGQEYIVLGLTIDAQENYIQVLVQGGNYWISFIPIQLFEIVDNRSSKYWQLKIFEDQKIGLWHPSFYMPYFNDQLSEDVPEYVTAFQNAYKEMQDEHNETIEYKDEKAAEIVNNLHRPNDSLNTRSSSGKLHGA